MASWSWRAGSDDEWVPYLRSCYHRPLFVGFEMYSPQIRIQRTNYIHGRGRAGKGRGKSGHEELPSPYLPTSYPSSSVGSPSSEKIKPGTPEVTPEFQIFRGALFPEVESVRECPQSYRNAKILKIPGSYGIPIS